MLKQKKKKILIEGNQTIDWNIKNLKNICDVIKQNESELANTDFKIKGNKAV